MIRIRWKLCHTFQVYRNNVRKNRQKPKHHVISAYKNSDQDLYLILTPKVLQKQTAKFKSENVKKMFHQSDILKTQRLEGVFDGDRGIIFLISH